ncbi:AAA family ATPase [Hydrogenivirga caldilitoris]|uniref:AAA family ATPase n=1 Tax=Hydrogenivirga caldilitoris TaxID=246264 RepID=UPI000EB29FD8|nr:MoxR family ATPase [Hydrogenivirga caldilitoris]
MNINAVVEEIAKVVRGKEEEIRRAVVCLLAGGHLLIEDIPGVGKTTLALALSRSMSLSFSRIQFTSDLLPSDITGSSVFDQSKREFVFKPGPIFNNIVLADEINRATPKTQSALLEAMAERQVTVDGKTYPLPEPFFVIATQNPLEHYGTYPLPESQMDRFMVKLSLGYPDRETEKEIVMGTNPLERVNLIREVANAQEILNATQEVKKVYVSSEIAEMVVDLVSQTRSDPNIILGISTRGAIHLVQCARALAYSKERDFVVPEDVLEMAVPVLSHRIIVREGVDKEEAIKSILQRIEVPR